jgi:hypothetical protein
MTTETAVAAVDPDAQEVAVGFQHENLEGWVPEFASPTDVFDAFEKAFDYRGDIAITLKDGSRLEGYVFDRRPGTSLETSFVKLYPVNSDQKLSISYAEIARLEFGKDRAAGKHWEAWLKKYRESKAAGVKNIGIEPDALD